MPFSCLFPALRNGQEDPAAITESDLDPYNASILDPVHLAFLGAVRPDTLAPQALVNVVFDGPKDEALASEKEMDAVIGGLGGRKLAEASAKAGWERRFHLYPTLRIS